MPFFKIYHPRTCNPPQNQSAPVKCHPNCTELLSWAAGSEHSICCYLTAQPNLTLNTACGNTEAALSAHHEFLQASVELLHRKWHWKSWVRFSVQQHKALSFYMDKIAIKTDIYIYKPHHTSEIHQKLFISSAICIYRKDIFYWRYVWGFGVGTQLQWTCRKSSTTDQDFKASGRRHAEQSDCRWI